MVKLAGRPGGTRVLNVGSGGGIEIRELLAMLEACTGMPAKIDWQPDRGLDVRRIVLDISALRRELDFVPTPLTDGLAATAAAFAPPPAAPGDAQLPATEIP